MGKVGEFAKGFLTGGAKGDSKAGKVAGGVFSGGLGRLKGVKKRVQARKEKRDAKKGDRLSLGGSPEEEKRLYDEAGANSAESRARTNQAFKQSENELKSARSAQQSAQTSYYQDRLDSKERDQQAYDAIGGIKDSAQSGSDRIGAAGSSAANEYTQGAQQALDQRNNALATGSLAGTAEGVLAQRQSALAGAPTITQANENNILANAANAQAAQQRSTQMLNRQAMGLAAGQGEGGALAMQQAMASAGAAAGDMAGQQNQQLADQVAQSRYAAAMGERGEVVDSANLGLQTRMGAAEQERANQMAIANANAGTLEGAAGNRAAAGMATAGAQSQLGYQASLADQAARAQAAQLAAARTAQSNQSNLQLQAQRANIATGNTTTAAGIQGQDQDYQSDILTAKYGAQKDRNENEGRSTAAKVLMPFGFLGN